MLLKQTYNYQMILYYFQLYQEQQYQLSHAYQQGKKRVLISFFRLNSIQGLNHLKFSLGISPTNSTIKQQHHSLKISLKIFIQKDLISYLKDSINHYLSNQQNYCYLIYLCLCCYYLILQTLTIMLLQKTRLLQVLMMFVLVARMNLKSQKKLEHKLLKRQNQCNPLGQYQITIQLLIADCQLFLLSRLSSKAKIPFDFITLQNILKDLLTTGNYQIQKLLLHSLVAAFAITATQF
ncbi:transmembrane protein, putative (macronuclear) [Tetrahymena thermophila SB210]|uniref:Transmembrane protein, putative n=1 Tax=Tetrahymena thermophila (strain SB210) TaxID=312017 RepID=W7XI59_TETTS|nr:transmembrane protein, putative [Tetrahymena thermophila SB210]EWS73029.1 transmembrane protein, putative [Tetrahymena thermophila SB210]|eukprot:XP_012654426.1 transmembrane protein, putative [Tetrahymena thermophila SB210]